MAKRRPTSRKAAKKPARKVAKKSARKKTVARAAAPSGVLSLKRLRSDLDLAVASLSRQVENRGPSAKLSNAQSMFARWAAEIDDLCDPNEQAICGPTMDIPLH